MAPDLRKLEEMIHSASIDDRRAAIEQLETITDRAALELVMELVYDSETGIRFLAKRALKKMAGALGVDISSLQPDRAFIQKLISDLEVGDTRQRLEACRKIARLGNMEAAETLYSCLERENHPEVLTAILDLLISLAAPENPEWMERYLLHSDKRVQIQAVKTSHKLYPDVFVDRFRQLFETGDPALVVVTAPILVTHDKVLVLDVIKGMLKDNHASARSRGVDALRSIATVEARNLLSKLLNDPDMDLRLKVSKALAEVDLAIARRLESAEPSLENERETVSLAETTPPAGAAAPPAPKASAPPPKRAADLDSLKELLTHQDYRVRLQAVQSVGHDNETRLLSFLIDRLAVEESKYVIASLVKVVAAMGGSRVLEQVAPFLNHPDSRVRANTVEALGTIGAQDVFDLVFPMLGDDDGRVKGNAVRVLWSFSQEKMLEKLHSMVESPEVWERSSALYTLEQIGHPKTRHLVKRLLGDTNLEIKVRAAELFTNIESGTAEGLATETTGFEDLDEAEIEIMNLSHADYRTRLKAALALYDIGTPDLAPRLFNLLKMEQNEYVLASLVKVIGRLGGEQAPDVLKPYLKHPDSRVRANTVEAIGMTPGKHRFDVLSACLEDADARVRANAIGVLSEIAPRRTQKILKAMINSSVTADRLTAVRCLKQIASPGSLKILKKLTSHQDTDVAEAARKSLQAIEKSQADPHAPGKEAPAPEQDIPPERESVDPARNREKLKNLVNAQISNLSSSNTRIAQRAKEMLKGLLDKSSLSFAEQVLDVSTNPRVVLPLLEILEIQAPAKAMYRVIPYLKDRRPEMKEMARAVLSRSDTREMNIRLLSDLRSGDRTVRRRAEQALWFIFKRRLGLAK